MLSYTAITEAPMEEADLIVLVAKVREIGLPEIRITIEAENRPALFRVLRDLNLELRSRGIKGIQVEDFTRGKEIDDE